MEQLFVAFSLLALLALLVQNRFDPALIFTAVAGSYYLFGLLEFGQWAGNYVNSSLLTLALLLILSLAIEKTTFVKDLSNRLITPGYYASLLRLGFFTSAVSAFLNNTAVVASLIATIKTNAYHKPSKLLIPLSYSAIFGGTMTLIGTSTNLIVNSFAIKEGLPSLQIFDFFLVGAAITVFGIAALLFASRFLPAYENKGTKPKDWFIETRVAKNCSLIGKSVEENGLRNLKEIFLVEIKRDGHFLAPVSPGEIIYEDDVLIFSGDIAHIEILKRFKGLNLTDEKMDLGSNLVEVIISNESSLLGQQVKDSNFRSKFDAAIVAMKSGGEDVSAIGSATLQVGDTLVLAVGSDFYGRDNIAKNFHILSNINKSKSLTKSQSALVLGSFLCAVLAGAFGILSLFKALLIVLALYLAAGFLRMGEIKRRFPYQIVLIVGSALSVAAVMIDTGLAQSFADTLISIFGSWGVYGSFVGVFLLTYLLTEIITNNAAAALSFPIAYSTALSLDASALPFIFAVAYGASASFLSPYGYQTNLMVSSVGGYKFSDYTKTGAFVSAVYAVVVLIGVPLIYGF